jgi:uncharacterized glyoxalase superfamily protein PhnB
MIKIEVTNKYLSFKGTSEDAISFVEEIHEAYRVSGMDMNKTLNDFLFSIEVALQEEGVYNF